VTGGRHARRAALPPAGYARDRQLDPAGLTVTVPAESDGVVGIFDFSALPGPPALLAASAAGFARLAGPDQPWRAAATCDNGYKAIRVFLRYAAALDPPPAVPADITPSVWAGWRLSRPATVHGRNCLLVTRQWLPRIPGIPDATAAAAARRIPAGPAPAEAAYTREEFDQIKAAAGRTFRAALTRIRASRDLLARWHDGEFNEPGLREQYLQTRPGTAEYVAGEALDILLRTGDVPLLESTARRTVVARHARALGGTGPLATWGRLFLTLPEAAALAVLLVCDQGWNRSVLDAMTVPDDMPGAGEDGLDIYRLPILKPRRPARSRYSSANLVDAGPGTSGRLIRQAGEATESARITLAGLGQPTSRLLVARRDQLHGQQDMFCLGVPAAGSVRQWADSAELPGIAGTVSMRRLRRTVLVLIRREPAQNTTQTHEQVYLLRDPATRREAEQVTAQGLAAAAAQARDVMRMLSDPQAARLAGTPEQARALADGRLDTATGACLDFTHAPSGPPGQPCTASFLDCLACRNAVATRRHLPRLAWLHRALDDLRGAVDPAVWAHDWRTHFLRLTALLEDSTTIAEREAAIRTVSDADRELISQLLTGRYTA
jgi:hypothetical protein